MFSLPQGSSTALPSCVHDPQKVIGEQNDLGRFVGIIERHVSV
jgi:hypothetical protein